MTPGHCQPLSGDDSPAFTPGLNRLGAFVPSLLIPQPISVSSERNLSSGPVDLLRLTRLREQPSTAVADYTSPRSAGWRASSGAQDLTAWEELLPAKPTYLPGFDCHMIVVALQPAARCTLWLADCGVRTVPVQAGSAFVVPAGEPSYLDAHGAAQRVLWLALRPRALYGAGRGGATATPAPDMPLRGRAWSGEPMLHGLALSIAHVRQAAQRSCPSFLDAMVPVLAAHLTAHKAATASHAPGRLSEHKLALLLEHLRARIAEPLRLDELAAMAGFTVFHFSHLFKASMGIPPMRYVHKMRMVLARELIETTRLSITEIGARVGLEDPAHFSRAYRAFWNESPSSLRKTR